MDDEIRSTSRAAFLGVAAAGIAIGVTACHASAETVATLPTIENVLRRPAKHKQVIATPRINGGAALRYAGNGIEAFTTAFAQGPGALHVVCVLYGTSMFFVADDTLWDKYRLFDVLDRRGDALPMMVHAPQNPFYQSRSNMPAAERKMTVEALTQSGVSWFVCNNALNEVTASIARETGSDPAAVYSDFRTHLTPGALVVPSGVASIVLAQEAGYTFLAA